MDNLIRLLHHFEPTAISVRDRAEFEIFLELGQNRGQGQRGRSRSSKGREVIQHRRRMPEAAMQSDDSALGANPIETGLGLTLGQPHLPTIHAMNQVPRSS